MDEARRTAATYEANADAYREKYRAGSVAARNGGPFLDALADAVTDATESNSDAGEPTAGGRVRVLDAGCGPGSDAAVFAERGLDVVGLDVTRSFLVDAAAAVDGAFCRGDLRALPFDDRAFDGAWCCAALHHLPKPVAADALAELERVLRDRGVLFCSVKRGDGAGFERDDDHGGGSERFFAYYRGEEFERALADAGFAADVRVDDRWVSALATPA